MENNINQMYSGRQPAALSPRGSESQPSDSEALQLEVSSIIKTERQKKSQQADQILQALVSTSSPQSPLSFRKSEQLNPVIQSFTDKELDEMELEMLVEECEELLAKIPMVGQEETTLNLELEQSHTTLRKQKERLEKEYAQLCLEVERQHKELDSYKFKVQVAHREADYYTHQIKEKTEILKKLDEQHQCKKKKK